MEQLESRFSKTLMTYVHGGSVDCMNAVPRLRYFRNDKMQVYVQKRDNMLILLCFNGLLYAMSLKANQINHKQTVHRKYVRCIYFSIKTPFFFKL